MAAKTALWIVTPVAALVSAVAFTRYEQRPWQAVPIGLAAGALLFVTLVLVGRARR